MSFESFVESRSFERIKSDFEGASYWNTNADMPWTHFENMKWLIAEIERMRDELHCEKRKLEFDKMTSEVNQRLDKKATNQMDRLKAIKSGGFGGVLQCEDMEWLVAEVGRMRDELRQVHRRENGLEVENKNLKDENKYFRNELIKYREAERHLKCPGCGMRTIIYNHYPDATSPKCPLCGGIQGVDCDIGCWVAKGKEEKPDICVTCEHWNQFSNDWNHGTCMKKAVQGNRVIVTYITSPCDMKSWWPKEKRVCGTCDHWKETLCNVRADKNYMTPINHPCDLGCWRPKENAGKDNKVYEICKDCQLPWEDYIKCNIGCWKSKKEAVKAELPGHMNPGGSIIDLGDSITKTINAIIDYLKANKRT